jgi:hypothetical protein
MNDKQMNELTEEQVRDLPAHLQMRIAYLKLQQKQQEEQRQTEQQQQEDSKKTPQQLIKEGLELQKQLDKETKDSLSD